MKYTVTSTRENGEHIQTVVNYVFDDGTQINNIDVAHFRPKTKVIIGEEIVKRGNSEKSKYDAISANKELVKEIEINKEVSVG